MNIISKVTINGKTQINGRYINLTGQNVSITDNGIYVNGKPIEEFDESGMFLGEKGCYLNMAAIEMNETRYGDTHVVKVSLAKEVVEKMTEEERKAIPILGGMHPLQSQAQQIQGQLDGASVCENMDDLPF